MSGHTTGPWKAQRDLRHYTNDGLLTDTSPKAWGVYGKYRVACIESGIGVAFDKDTEAEANSRLIAAAPEMLEQCKLFEQTIEYYIKLDMAHDDEESANLKRYSLHELRAVIAKAEGRET